MKIQLLMVLLTISTLLTAQNSTEKTITSEISAVTVFFEGAQISRKKAVDIPKGTTLLKFTKLSPFIDFKSVQVSAKGAITVLNVNHQLDFIDEAEKSEAVKSIITLINKLEDQKKLQKTLLEITHEELAFLKDNRTIGGKNNELSISNLKQASIFYSERLNELKLKEIDLKKKESEIQQEINKYNKQLQTIGSKKEYPNGEILVKVEAKEATVVNFEISYYVENAGWYPSYDIRAKNINHPIDISYKANVRQDTKVDWKNVQLTFASTSPKNSGVAPELKPYFLDYYSRVPQYENSINSVSGFVFDENNEPLLGTTIYIKGTSIGTVTDENGHYSISVPSTESQLTFSFIGYETQTLNITDSNMNVFLKSSEIMLNEVVTKSYAIMDDEVALSSALQGRVAGINIRGNSTVKHSKQESLAVPFQQSENQTSFNFTTNVAYTIQSNNKNNIVEMTSYEIPVSFQYYAVPKITTEVFLKAYITNWEMYNFIEGEANIYFEDTFMGKSILDVRFATDTLQLTLGVDKNVTIQRKKIKDHTNRQFIGSKKEETHAWETVVKNNKSEPISMVLFDQIPVSKIEEIEIELLEDSKGNFEKENGEIRWDFELKPNTEKKLELKFLAKYPKNRSISIE